MGKAWLVDALSMKEGVMMRREGQGGGFIDALGSPLPSSPSPVHGKGKHTRRAERRSQNVPVVSVRCVV